MIIIKLMGGLGNQMFQYALGRRLALERGVPLKLDLGWFESQNLRSFELGQFKIQAEPANPAEIQFIKGISGSRFSRVMFRLLQKMKPYYRRKFVLEEKVRKFDPNVLKVPRCVYLSGYWQNLAYFSPIRETLLEDFQPRDADWKDHFPLVEKIRHSNSVCLHVRRGDYFSDSKLARKYAVCTKEYYMEAIEIFSAQVESPHFFIFSDDLKWCRNNLRIQGQHEFVTTASDQSAAHEMMAISYCKHFVISNSTFGWWGWWLSRNTGMIQISPLYWFKKKDPEFSCLIDDSWVRL